MYRPACQLHHTLRGAAAAHITALRHCITTTTTQCSKEFKDNNSKNNSSSGRTYNPATYQLPYTIDDSQVILDTLNTADVSQLTALRLTQVAARRLIRSREEAGGFCELSQVLDVDGIGLKGMERLFECVLRAKQHGHDPPSHKEISLDTLHQRRLIKPRLHPDILKSIDYFVSLHVTAGYLAWAQFDRQGRINNLAAHELLNANSRFDTPRIYEKVLEAQSKIPDADLYVWEERSSYGHLAKASMGTLIVALQLAQIRGMLLPLLEHKNRRGQEGASRLVHLKETVVPKLFRLQAGGERLPGLPMVDKMISCGHFPVDWVPAPSPPPLQDPEVQEAYFSSDAAERRYVATAVLVGVAFHRVVMQLEPGALVKLCQ